MSTRTCAQGVIQAFGLAPVSPSGFSGDFDTVTDISTPREVPPHPVIDFSGDSRATAREYAERANSRVLKPQHQADLKAASLGMQVDVYDFREAATAALSLASTRAGQSSERRQYAKEARHLIYIADAVIRNHADGLPVYEPGERSPKLREAQQRVEEEKAGRLTAEERAEELDEALTSAQARAGEAEKVAHEQAEALNRLNEQYDTTQANLSAVTAERDSLQAGSDALREALTATQKQAEAYRLTLAHAKNLFRQAEAPRYADVLDGYVQALLDLAQGR